MDDNSVEQIFVLVLWKIAKTTSIIEEKDIRTENKGGYSARWGSKFYPVKILRKSSEYTYAFENGKFSLHPFFTSLIFTFFQVTEKSSKDSKSPQIGKHGLQGKTKRQSIWTRSISRKTWRKKSRELIKRARNANEEERNEEEEIEKTQQRKIKRVREEIERPAMFLNLY